MPKPEFIPAALAEDTLEGLLARGAHRGHALYLALAALLLAALLLLPLIRVAVSVQSPGLIRPVVEKHEIVVRASGFVEVVGVRENERVAAGQLLLRLRAEPLRARQEVVDSQLARLEEERHDLRLLVTAAEAALASREALRTGRWRQALAELDDELVDLALREARAERELERARLLAARELIPRREVDDRAFELSQLRRERALRVERARRGWHEALAAVEVRLLDLRARAVEVRQEGPLHRVEAPVAGTVEELAGLSPGSFVQAGARLAVLSPLSPLVAEVYVAPRDIGLLREGGPVRLQIDAFNYHDWGFLTGRVARIADDFVLLEARPVFRVEVTLDRTHLRLRNGVRGELKKGMTLVARFTVAERTLLQLLRDDVSDWLNPADPA